MKTGDDKRPPYETLPQTDEDHKGRSRALTGGSGNPRFMWMKAGDDKRRPYEALLQTDEDHRDDRVP